MTMIWMTSQRPSKASCRSRLCHTRSQQYIPSSGLVYMMACKGALPDATSLAEAIPARRCVRGLLWRLPILSGQRSPHTDIAREPAF
jgi:hypothetical protein